MTTLVDTRVDCAEIVISAVDMMIAAVWIALVTAHTSVARINSAIITIVAILRNKHTTQFVVALTQQASVTIVTNEAARVTTRRLIALPHVTLRSVIGTALNRTMHTATNQIRARIACACVAVVARTLLVQASASLRIARIVGANVFVVAILGHNHTATDW